jgi:hypothetical protein
LLAGSDTSLGPLTLPASGPYTVIVQAGSSQIGGIYNLTLTVAKD